MEAAEPEEPEPQAIIDSATAPQQEVSKAESPESLARLEEFQLLRQQFSEAEPAAPQPDTVDAPSGPTPTRSEEKPPPDREESDEIVRRRQEFERLRMQAAEPEEPEPQVIVDCATEPPPEASKPESPESLARLEEFQLLRQQFSEAEPAPPEADRPAAAPPPNAGPTEPEAPDEEEWHRAFERLAASTDLPDQDREQPSDVYRAVEGSDFQPQRQTEQPVSPPSAPATESPGSAARTDNVDSLVKTPRPPGCIDRGHRLHMFGDMGYTYRHEIFLGEDTCHGRWERSCLDARNWLLWPCRKGPT